jgi:hypothetical protein
MSNKYTTEYKPDSLVSDKTTEDLLSDLKHFDKFCLEAIRSKPFWSPTDKTVFADRWTIFMQRFLSHGKTFHSFNHRLVLDEDDYEERNKKEVKQ